MTREYRERIEVCENVAAFSSQMGRSIQSALTITANAQQRRVPLDGAALQSLVEALAQLSQANEVLGQYVAHERARGTSEEGRFPAPEQQVLYFHLGR